MMKFFDEKLIYKNFSFEKPHHMVYCNMPCSTILLEENILMNLVIVCEYSSKNFPSK